MAGAAAKRKAEQGEAEPGLAGMVRELEEDILLGRLRPRERLVEDQLMARFAAKRHMVRQALAELERLGIVVRTPNRGAAVRDFTAREVEEIYALRNLLQAGAVDRMRLPCPPALVARLTAIQRRHDAAVARTDVRAIDAANEEFHGAFFAACGNQHLTEAITRYAQLSRAMRLYPIADPAVLEQVRNDHWEIIQALRDADRRRLRMLVVRHLEPSKRLYLAARAAIAAADPPRAAAS